MDNRKSTGCWLREVTSRLEGLGHAGYRRPKRRRSAELGQPLLQIVAVHRRGQFHAGVQLPEERLRERRYAGRVRQVKHHVRGPLPVEGRKVHRLRLPPLSCALHSCAQGPVLDRLVSCLNRHADPCHDTHVYPPLNSGRRCGSPPRPGPPGTANHPGRCVPVGLKRQPLSVVPPGASSRSLKTVCTSPHQPSWTGPRRSMGTSHKAKAAAAEKQSYACDASTARHWRRRSENQRLGPGGADVAWSVI